MAIQRNPRRRRTAFGDLSRWLWARRGWWLLPVVIALVLVAGLIGLGGTAAAPFIYPLF